MDTALPQKFPFILDRNLAKANCTGNRVCTSCDTVVLVSNLFIFSKFILFFFNEFQIYSCMPLYYLTACTGLQARLFHRKQGSMYRRFFLFTLNEGTEGKLFISLSLSRPAHLCMQV